MRELLLKITKALQNLFNLILIRILYLKIKKNLISNKTNFINFTQDLISCHLIVFGTFEEPYLKIIYNKFKNILIDACAIDIGANIGNHSVFLSKICKSVHAYEPNPVSFNILKLNANKFNIKKFNIGLSNCEKKASLYLSKGNIGASKVAFYKKSNINVKLIKLDKKYNVYKQKRVGLIKIDVEGHELKVLQGARKIIRYHHPIVACEWHQSDSQKKKIIKELKKNNYKNCFLINLGLFALNLRDFFWSLISFKIQPEIAEKEICHALTVKRPQSLIFFF